MQMSIHYRAEDQYLIDKLEREAARRRKSKSAMLLTILEEYFESNEKIGQILKDMKAIRPEQLNKALTHQRKTEEEKRIGQILLEKGYLEERQLERALQVQSPPTNNENRF